jgi:CBS domain-containing protein
MKVKELMTKQVAIINATDAASTALKVMWDCDCGALPVVDEQSRVVAVITDRDIAMTALFRDTPPSALTVSDAMSHEIHYCSPDDDVLTAEQLMRSQQIRRLPVLSGDQHLAGILSLVDVVRSAAGRGRPRAGSEEIAAVLADICTPRGRTAARASAPVI